MMKILKNKDKLTSRLKRTSDAFGNFLLLDSSKARKELGWKDFLTFDSAVEWTAHWYQNFDAKGAKDLSLAQIEAFLALKSNLEYRTP